MVAGVYGFLIDAFFVFIFHGQLQPGESMAGAIVPAIVIAVPAAAALVAGLSRSHRTTIILAAVATVIYALFGFTIFSIGLFCLPAAVLCGIGWRREANRGPAKQHGYSRESSV